MWFKNQKKPSSKVRFQHQHFKKQLQDARDYKRHVRQSDQNLFQTFLYKIGLGGIWARISVAVVIFVTLYLAFIPSFLTIKEIQINGGPINIQNNAGGSARAYFKKNALFAQNNLLFLSKKRLKDYLLKNNKNIFRIDSIEKKFPHELIINLQPRVAKYLIESTNKNLIVSNDGLIMGQSDSPVASSTESGLISFKISAGLSGTLFEKIFDEKFLEELQTLSLNLPEITGSHISSFSAEGLNEPDLEVYIDPGYKILFDLKPDLDLTLKRLKILLQQISPADTAKLYYIDVRIQNRGYICFKKTACAIEQQNTATSTLPGL